MGKKPILFLLSIRVGWRGKTLNCAWLHREHSANTSSIKTQ